MKLRELPPASLARSGLERVPAAAGNDVTLLDLGFRASEEVALADDVRDARPPAIAAFFARLRGRGLAVGPGRFRGPLRIGTAPAPTRQ